MKSTPGSGKRSGFDFGGEPIVTYINSLPYTAKMLERRAVRLAEVASHSESVYTVDTMKSHK